MIDLELVRRSPRRPVDLSCAIVSKAWDAPVHYRMTDLSQHGAWVRTTFPMAVGEQLVLSFRPPTSRREVTVFATVARGVAPGSRGGSGMGLRFAALSAEEQRTLQAGTRDWRFVRRSRRRILRSG